MIDQAVRPRTSAFPAGHRRRPWVTAFLAVAVLLIGAMWVYYFFFASSKAVYRVDDDAWRARAESICETSEAKRLELVDTSAGYIANPTEAQMIERADVVDRATAILTDQLDDVTAVMPASDRDRKLVDTWAGYYRILLGDREAYTARLRAFDLQPYLETPVEGGPVSNVIVDFTTVNEIRHCQPPGELGGDF